MPEPSPYKYELAFSDNGIKRSSTNNFTKSYTYKTGTCFKLKYSVKLINVGIYRSSYTISFADPVVDNVAATKYRIRLSQL